MKTKADKANTAGQSRAVVNRDATQRKTEETTFGFGHNRPDAITQWTVAEAMDNSPRMVAQRAENRTGLPDNLKAGLESLSGLSMDNVKVHRNSAKPAQLNALAYTQGTDIHVRPGQERHLPHEAWHVVQQSQGRVKPTINMKGTDINDDPGLEKEADVMGTKAASVAAH